MANWKSGLRACVSAAGIVLLVGCQASQQDTRIQQIPQITELCKDATDTRAHRSREPFPNGRDLILQKLSAECDRLIADVETWEASAELTAANGQPRSNVRSDIASLRTALEELRAAAARGDIRAMRSAHFTALSAYARVGKVMNPPDTQRQ